MVSSGDHKAMHATDYDSGGEDGVACLLRMAGSVQELERGSRAMEATSLTKASTDSLVGSIHKMVARIVLQPDIVGLTLHSNWAAITNLIEVLFWILLSCLDQARNTSCDVRCACDFFACATLQRLSLCLCACAF